jgi:hypothetical protein
MTRQGVTAAQVLDLILAHGGALENKSNRSENAEIIRSVEFTF